MKKPKYLTKLGQVPELSQNEKNKLQAVSEKFVFRTNEYYQSLIDWDDPDDPIRRIVMPVTAELEEWGELDASNESAYTRVPGLEHKYTNTALLLVNDVCGAYCRFCFRKRLFMDDNDEVVRDVSEGLAYIRKHPEIDNVLLTGGDPLLMSTAKLEKIIRHVCAIPHVKIIRIGTKLPAFNPFRITEDPSLPEMIHRYISGNKQIYIMAHFNHPRELTEVAERGLNILMDAGAAIVNQTPMIQGVNDNPRVLATLFNRLSYQGIPPYYVFQCRPTEGNKPFTIPVEKACEIFQQALLRCGGLARRARLVMSHDSGKIEIAGKTKRFAFFRYHQAVDEANVGRFMIFPSNPKAYWFDDYLKTMGVKTGKPLPSFFEMLQQLKTTV